MLGSVSKQVPRVNLLMLSYNMTPMRSDGAAADFVRAESRRGLGLAVVGGLLVFPLLTLCIIAVVNFGYGLYAVFLL